MSDFVRSVSPLALLLGLVACGGPLSEPSGRAPSATAPYRDPSGRFEVREVEVVREPILVSSVVERLPTELRPTARQARAVVLRLTFAFDKDELREIRASSFALVYDIAAGPASSPCVGLSLGDSDKWGLAGEGDAQVFLRAWPEAAEKLLFLVPARVVSARLEHRGDGQTLGRIAEHLQLPEPEEDTASWNEPSAESRQQEEVRARHILLRVDEARSLDQAREQLATIRARLAAGEDFVAVATEVSDDPASAARGGDLGFFGRGRMAPEFEEAAFAAQPGELVGPVETGFGLHLIEVVEKRSVEVGPP